MTGKGLLYLEVRILSFFRVLVLVWVVYSRRGEEKDWERGRREGGEEEERLPIHLDIFDCG